MKRLMLTLLLTTIFGLSTALPTVLLASETPSADGAKVYFVNLRNQDQITAPFNVIFGLSGMGIAPAGAEKPNTGHHHLLIDLPALGLGEDGVDEFEFGLPSDKNHVHFGGGQTEFTLDLPAGQHMLQLVLGDYGHAPHSRPLVSDILTTSIK